MYQEPPVVFLFTGKVFRLSDGRIRVERADGAGLSLTQREWERAITLVRNTSTPRLKRSRPRSDAGLKNQTSIGVSFSLRDWLRNERRPSETYELTIRRLLNIPMEDLKNDTLTTAGPSDKGGL